MKKSRLLAATAGAALLAGLVGAPSAQAETTGVTFAVSGGGLSMAYKVVDSVSTEDGDIGTATSGPLGATASGSLGTLVVTDARATTLGWKVSASMSGPFQAVDGQGAPVDLDGDSSTADEVIACTNAKLTTGTPTTSGTVVVTNAAAAGLSLTDLDGDGDCSDTNTIDAAPVVDGAVLLTATATGSNSAEFTSSLAVTIPSSALAGTYKGTLTQTAA